MTIHSSISHYLATHGQHICTSWPCSLPGMHHIPNGIWPTPDRLSPAQRTRAIQARLQETPEQRDERLAIAQRIHASTLAQHRHKALAAREAKRQNKYSNIVADYDGTWGGVDKVAQAYGYTRESMEKLLRRLGMKIERKPWRS